MISIAVAALMLQAPRQESNGLWGYINMTPETPPAEFGYGASLYASAWPLLDKPISGFQVGLCSTWILPDNRDFKSPLLPKGTVARDSMPERGPNFWTVFQTIEGGLGFWVSSKYPTSTAKFRMNGTTDGYNHELSTPGWEFSGKPLEGDYMGIVQLSNRVLIPPDGVTLDKDTCGELFGYAWMALPLIKSHKYPVATGNQCWTAFFNTKNFRGPVAFFLPSAWSKISQKHEPALGRGLDAMPGIASSGAIEINTVPQLVSKQIDDKKYTRIPQFQFPADRKGQTLLMQDLTAYSKKALWDKIVAAEESSKAPSSKFESIGKYLPKIKANPLQVRQGTKEWAKGTDQWVETTNIDPYTFGLQWKPQALTPWKSGIQKGVFPDYYIHRGNTVEAAAKSQIPIESGLNKASFAPANFTQSYVPSESGEGVWKNPGPKAGPFQVHLVDHSVVTYYWYRFIDQPSLQRSGMSIEEKAKLQSLVEKIQRSWTPDKEYMAPPRIGTLARLDSKLLVTPPKGFEIGYVPVAFRQDPDK
jgi:hypothetical protein